jgi:hypothetical protein
LPRLLKLSSAFSFSLFSVGKLASLLLLSGLLLITFALTMTLALGVKAPLRLSVFSAAGGALLLGARGKFPLRLDELLQRNRQGK